MRDGNYSGSSRRAGLPWHYSERRAWHAHGAARPPPPAPVPHANVAPSEKGTAEEMGRDHRAAPPGYPKEPGGLPREAPRESSPFPGELISHTDPSC